MGDAEDFGAVMKNKPIVFVPYIDPFIWIYLLLTGRFFRQVYCFQYAFVPALFFKRLNIVDLGLQSYELLGERALKFSETLTDTSQINSTVELGGSRIFLLPLNLKARAVLLNNIFLSIGSLQKVDASRVGGCFLLSSPLLTRQDRKLLGETITQETGLRGRNSFFLARVHPWLMRFIAMVVFLAFALKFKVQNRHHDFDHQSPCVLFNEISDADAHTDADKKLSGTFLVDGDVLTKDKVLYIIKQKARRQHWQALGYRAIAGYSSFFGLLRWRDICRFARCMPMRHFSMVNKASFYAPLEFIGAFAAAKSGAIKGLVYTNSSFWHVPPAAVVFKAKNISVTMVWYSASIYKGVGYAYLCADDVFVWNDEVKEFIEGHPQHGDVQMKNVGPLMFANQLKGNDTPTADAKQFQIGIYAVDPKDSKLLDAVRISTNYTPRFYDNFMDDILRIHSKSTGVTLKLKPKREIEVQRHLNTEGFVREQGDINPYISVAGCDLVICMPFTSIYYVALALGVPAIFYSPEGVDYHGSSDRLHKLVVTGAADLESAINEVRNNQNSYPRLATQDLERFYRPSSSSPTEQLRVKITEMLAADGKGLESKKRQYNA